MKFSDYKQIKATNWSSLRDLCTSPKLCRYRQQHPRRDTPALAMGRAVHCAVLRPDDFPLEHVVYRESKSKGKGSRTAWREFQEAHAGDTILDTADYDRCLAIRDAVRSDKAAWRHLSNTQEAEAVIEWQHPSGRRCKGLLDCITPSTIVDLKTTRNPGSWSFGGDATTYGYYAQLAFYQAGLYAARDTRLLCVIIAAESIPPYDVVVHRVPDRWLKEGRLLVETLLEKLDHCERLDEWPGRHPEEVDLEPREYAAVENTDDPTGCGLDFGGM